MFSIPPMFFAGGDVMSIADVSVTRTAASGTITATYTLKTTGDIFYNTNATTDATSDKGDYVTPKGNGGNYECFATVTAGSLTSGTTGSWLDLGAADRSWTRNITTSGDNIVTFTLAIRRKGTTTTLKTVTITLEASE